MPRPGGGIAHPAPASPAPSRVAHANWLDDYGFGQLLIGTELMLFFGLPSIIRSL
jgi:hypothetical protein